MRRRAGRHAVGCYVQLALSRSLPYWLPKFQGDEGCSPCAMHDLGWRPEASLFGLWPSSEGILLFMPSFSFSLGATSNYLKVR